MCKGEMSAEIRFDDGLEDEQVREIQVADPEGEGEFTAAGSLQVHGLQGGSERAPVREAWSASSSRRSTGQP